MVGAKVVTQETSAVLSPDESWRFLDTRARAIADMSADAFLTRIARGDYDDLADDLDHAARRGLLPLSTGSRWSPAAYDRGGKSVAAIPRISRIKARL